MEQNKGYKLEEIEFKSGITRRNIKFWCSVYKIKPKKIGRSNYYSELQFELLKLINFLSDSHYFTQKYIKLIVDYNQNPDKFESLHKSRELIIELNRFFADNVELLKLNLNIFSLDEKMLNAYGYPVKKNETNTAIKIEKLKSVENNETEKLIFEKNTAKKNQKIKAEKKSVQVQHPTSAESAAQPVSQPVKQPVHQQKKSEPEKNLNPIRQDSYLL
ncbi:MAG TPA: MerR family transcriptional regulator [bacterium]|nr:MerR family transcriptional regulator [bacterium]HPN31951.1 MerR family transcriptional regulator [bacterium]